VFDSVQGIYDNTVIKPINTSVQGIYDNTLIKPINTSVQGIYDNTLIKPINTSVQGIYDNTLIKPINTSVQGIYDNTVILFLSDNGGPTSEGAANNWPLRGGKKGYFEGGLRSYTIFKVLHLQI
jgi:hypothetical protein